MNCSFNASHAVKIGLVVVVLYVLCLFWRFTIVDPAVAQMHLLNLKLAFPGFQGYDALSILWGGVMSFFYGFIFSLIFHWLHRDCCQVKK
ncbi:MAG: hypothetical protein Q8P56_02165 [Candidatus Uhrbacteria bacterium]|nr:hypothetical protein [Candidatus Uhrbacteria bacterium]